MDMMNPWLETMDIISLENHAEFLLDCFDLTTPYFYAIGKYIQRNI